MEIETDSNLYIQVNVYRFDISLLFEQKMNWMDSRPKTYSKENVRSISTLDTYSKKIVHFLNGDGSE